MYLNEIYKIKFFKDNPTNKNFIFYDTPSNNNFISCTLHLVLEIFGPSGADSTDTPCSLLRVWSSECILHFLFFCVCTASGTIYAVLFSSGHLLLLLTCRV